jgi:hypothetical protein
VFGAPILDAHACTMSVGQTSLQLLKVCPRGQIGLDSAVCGLPSHAAMLSAKAQVATNSLFTSPSLQLPAIVLAMGAGDLPA